MGLLPSFGTSYGPLQPLHDHIINTAQPVTLQTAHHLLVYPLTPLFLQAWLLQCENTRKYRIPLGIASVLFTCVAWKGYRFYEPFLNAGNNLLGVMFLHFIGRAVEFALLEDPVIDPFMAKGRSRIMCAYDLCCNSRWIGLRPVNAVESSSSSIKSPERHTSPTAPVSDDKWLPRPSKIRTRRQAVLRHARLAYTYLLAFDTLLNLLRYFGRENVGLSHVPPGGVDKFFSDPYILLPRSRYATRAPDLLVDLCVKAFLGGGVLAMLSGGYHLAAAVMVGCGVYEVEAWEVDLFNGPMAAGSVLEFWGKGWHQVFRHHFNLLSTLIVHHLHLPRLFLLPLAFALSGALHALGQLSMSPSPSPPDLFLFFFIQSLGCLAEIMWKRVTGKRVGGWTGWMWKNLFMVVTAGVPLRTELQSGLGGTWFTPPLGGGVLAGAMIRWVVDRP